MHNRFFRSRVLLRFSACFALAVVGCGTAGTGAESFSDTPSPAEGTESTSSEVGSVSFNLEIGNSKIDSVQYDISGGHFQKTGTIDVSQSPRISAIIGGIPFGSGYAATLTAGSAQGVKLSCNGTANFDVTSANVTPVEVRMSCQELLAVPVPRGATAALGAILLASGMTLLRGKRRQLGRA